MSLWWIPAALAAWFVLAVVLALALGPALARRGEAPRPPGDDDEGQGS